MYQEWGQQKMHPKYQEWGGLYILPLASDWPVTTHWFLLYTLHDLLPSS